MCVAVPGEIVATADDGTGIVDFGGTRRSVSLMLVPGAAKGDYVIVHAGFALHRVEASEARATLELFRGVLDAEPD